MVPLLLSVGSGCSGTPSRDTRLAVGGLVAITAAEVLIEETVAAAREANAPRPAVVEYRRPSLEPAVWVEPPPPANGPFYENGPLVAWGITNDATRDLLGALSRCRATSTNEPELGMAHAEMRFDESGIATYVKATNRDGSFARSSLTCFERVLAYVRVPPFATKRVVHVAWFLPSWDITR